MSSDPITPEALAAYEKLAENVRERFGDNWQIVEDFDDELSVRTEDSTSGFYTEVFSTGQTDGEDPSEVAGFLAAAIDNVPAMAAAISEAKSERDRLAEQVSALKKLTQDDDGNRLHPESELPVGVFYGVLYGGEATSRD